MEKENSKECTQRVTGFGNGLWYGILTSLLKQNNNLVYGIDLTFEYLIALEEKKIEIDSINGTAEFLPFQNRCFDCIVASYLPKYVNLNILISECRRVLKQKGQLILHDFTYPKKPANQLAGKFILELSRLFGNLMGNGQMCSMD